MSFEMLADNNFAPRPNDWLQQGAHLRRMVRQNADLTAQRTAFLSQYAIANAHGGKGTAHLYPCYSPALAPTGLNTAIRTMAQALAGYPRYSARLLLTFRLLTPLLTKDDDPFYLFDNPARKDHLLGLPYLSAASIKGLSADAHQRAFPGTFITDDFGDAVYVSANAYQRILTSPQPWAELGKDDPNRTRTFRHADPHARRLFGIADDGANIESEKGRLHFAPVWFNKLQLLVMNPGDPTTAMGTQPIQFEAIAPGQTGVLEVVYFNPHGIKDSDEATVRADLARWLAAVANWWPALGLGAKRLAGYGAIQPEKAVLQAVGWSGMGAGTGPSETPTSTIPDYVREFQNEHGELVLESELENRLALPGESGERLKTLINQKEQLQVRKQELQKLGKAAEKDLKQVKKDIDRINKEKEQLIKPLESEKQKLRARYRIAQTWLKDNTQKPEPTDTKTAVKSQFTLEECTKTGPESWLNLAHWIAE